MLNMWKININNFERLSMSVKRFYILVLSLIYFTLWMQLLKEWAVKAVFQFFIDNFVLELLR